MRTGRCLFTGSTPQGRALGVQQGNSPGPHPGAAQRRGKVRAPAVAGLSVGSAGLEEGGKSQETTERPIFAFKTT